MSAPESRTPASIEPEQKVQSRLTRVIRVEIAPWTIFSLVLVIAGLWLSIRLLPVILVLVMALMIVGTLGPAVDWLEQRRVRRGAGIAIVFSMLFVATLLIFALTIPELVNQVRSLIGMEPALRERLAEWFARSPLTANLADTMRNVQYDALIKSSAASVLTFFTLVVESVAYGFGAIFLALYMMLDRDRLRGALFAVVPRTHHIRLSRILVNLNMIVGGYIRGQAITSALMAAFVFVLLTACGIPNALVIAVFGGLADVLPYIGIFLTMGPAVAAALPFGVVIVTVVFVLMLIYEEFESRVLVPVVYGRALRMPSSVVLFSLIAGATLFGIIGALLALPVAAMILMLIDELRVDLPGETEQAKDAEIRKKDESGELEYARRTEGMPAEEAAAIAVEMTGDRKKAEDGKLKGPKLTS
ncbi:MAG: AI-2E family transporter [Gallionella sp.]|nr:AI-2E family transporter [Gallionella sp.]